jgi:hypothetical protein
LIDLSFDDKFDYYPVLLPNMPICEANIPDVDKVYLNNIDKACNSLPLYQAVIGGSIFKVLIDSGASVCYAHPKVITHALSVEQVLHQAVETADGKQSSINQKINFRMFLGDKLEYQEVVSAFVFESKFDIILGKNWLKLNKPTPDWFNDTWNLGNNIIIQPLSNGRSNYAINSLTNIKQAEKSEDIITKKRNS